MRNENQGEKSVGLKDWEDRQTLAEHIRQQLTRENQFGNGMRNALRESENFGGKTVLRLVAINGVRCDE